MTLPTKNLKPFIPREPDTVFKWTFPILLFIRGNWVFEHPQMSILLFNKIRVLSKRMSGPRSKENFLGLLDTRLRGLAQLIRHKLHWAYLMLQEGSKLTIQPKPELNQVVTVHQIAVPKKPKTRQPGTGPKSPNPISQSDRSPNRPPQDSDFTPKIDISLSQEHLKGSQHHKQNFYKSPEKIVSPDSRRLRYKKKSSDDDSILGAIFFKDGLTYLKLRDYKEAMLHFQKASDLRQEALHMAYYGWSLFKHTGEHQDQRKEAKELINKAIELDPSDDTSYFFLGQIYHFEDNLQKAVDQIKQTLTINPTHKQAKALLCQWSLKREPDTVFKWTFPILLFIRGNWVFEHPQMSILLFNKIRVLSKRMSGPR